MVNLSYITLKYTRNANFLFTTADTYNIANISLEGLTTKDVTITQPAFRINSGHSMSLYNITANNITGPLFQISDVMAHNFSKINFNNMYISKKDSSDNYFIFYFSKITLVKKGLNTSKPRDTYIDNFNLNGYTSIDGIDFANNANSSFFLIGHTGYGK